MEIRQEPTFRIEKEKRMSVRLDEMDRKILGELQEDASQSLDEIARKVGSSKTPVWNRIRKMKDAGVIGRQTAILDPEALGLEACFFVLIRTSEHEAEWQKKFLKTLQERPEVLEARVTSASRQNSKKLSSVQELRDAFAQYPTSFVDAIPGTQLEIENSDLEPEIVAEQIVSFFKLEVQGQISVETQA